MTLLHRIGGKPVIAALRHPANIQAAIDSEVDNIFFMGGTVVDITEAVRIAKDAGRGAFVHLDLIRGLSSTDRESVEFIADTVKADGIVTPKSHLIKEAKKLGLYGVLHLFMIDSLAMQNGLKAVESTAPDGVEIMPGLLLKVIEYFAEANPHIPIIASGLIQTPEEAGQCLHAGATSLSVSERALWNMTFQDF
ncbi:glycerol-3-phosphate responsive antiterminator [Paenibacillus sp. TRM 82003]|nr:glycerol-3-phosphate responsive antiterminator [Paenibacillus sp. TRM 82003]MCI3923367.1 glycerol-3-phosphate responsive antiterminator [Paenibacillus sp. TRM 82003]